MSFVEPATTRKLLFVAALVSATSAFARSFGEHGGYEVAARESVSEQDRGWCAMMEEFEGPGETRFTLLRRLQEPDLILLSVANYNWSVKEDQKYDIAVRIPGKWQWKREAVGTRDGIYKGLLTAFEYGDFMPELARAKTLHFVRDDVVIDRLSMAGTGAAKLAFERCWSYLVRDETEKKRKWHEYDHIPQDPFKPQPDTSEHSGKAADPANAPRTLEEIDVLLKTKPQK